jgi:drug/metabolite transporter (DMT)-like permease
LGLIRRTNDGPTLSVTATAADPARQQMLLGISLRIAAMACVAALTGLVKWCGEQDVPVMQIVFFRNAFAFVPICLYMARTTGFGVLKTQRPIAHATRSAVGLIGMTSGFSAVQFLPLTDAAAFQFTSPIFMAALAAPILAEHVDRHRWAAVIVGFIGVLIIIRPIPGHMNLAGAALGVTGAVATAFAMITVRELGRTEAGAAIVFYFTVAGTLAGLASLPFGWASPEPLTLGFLVLIGLFGGVAQLLMTEALRIAPVGLVAPFDYTQLVWAALFGFLVWGERPHLATLIGAVLVAASGAYIVVRETRRATRAGSV